jgi:hypothetical protein
MGTYHFRRLFGKHLTGVTSSTRVSRQGHGARLSGRLRYNSAARLADGRRPSRRPAAARAPRRARARRRAASGERREFLMESCGPALWESRDILKPPGFAICGARVVHSRSLARSTCGAGGCVDVRFFFTSRPPATERQLLRRASRSQSQSRRRCPSLLLLMRCRPSRWTTKTNQIR